MIHLYVDDFFVFMSIFLISGGFLLVLIKFLLKLILYYKIFIIKIKINFCIERLIFYILIFQFNFSNQTITKKLISLKGGELL